MLQGRFFAKVGNWQYYVARDGKGRCPIRTSRSDAEADAKSMGGEYVVDGLHVSTALSMIAADQKYKEINATLVAA